MNFNRFPGTLFDSYVNPHDVSETEYREPSSLRGSWSCKIACLYLTFGFLRPNKGIETMLKALPAVLEKYPHVLYMVLGITHPVEKKHNSETN